MATSDAMRHFCKSVRGYVIVPIQVTSSHGLATTNLHFVWQGRILKPLVELPALSLRVSEKPVQIGIEYHCIGANVGITQAGRGHMTVDELLRCAHVALSRARNTHMEYCFFDPKMDAHVRERALLERDLRAAIRDDDIRPYYQPIVDLKSRQIVSFECLARWHHPVSGTVTPDTFIPLAEELGLIDELAVPLFERACRDAATWPEHVSLSFNFSPSQLGDRTFAGQNSYRSKRRGATSVSA